MEEIAKNTFIEKSYPGVISGALKLRDGLLMIDAPLRAEDHQNWRQRFNDFSSGSKQLMVMLDTHTDRLIGMQLIGMPIIAQENAVEIIQGIPSTARGSEIKTGSDPDPHDHPQSIRWVVPDMTYSNQMSIYWDEQPVTVTHQPGGHLAGSWVRYDEEKVIFVGDSVIINEPPYLGWSDLDLWIDELTWLSSDTFKGYKIISGRNDIVRQRSILKMINYLGNVKEAVDDLVDSEDREEGIIQIVPNLLRRLNYDREMTELYKIRLTRGLRQLLSRRDLNRTQAS